MVILKTRHQTALIENKEINILIDSSIKLRTRLRHFCTGRASLVILRTSVLSLAHTAAIMEQSESMGNRNYVLNRMELLLAGDFIPGTKGLVLNSRLSNPDHKTKYSEVWGVGCGIEAMSNLLGTKPQYTITISKSGKRMDFFTYKGTEKYIYETKGTSYPDSKRPIYSIKLKKLILKGLSFGTVTRAVRNKNNVTIEVYDPPVETFEVGENELVICLLRHYTKVLFLSGFDSIAIELNKRVKILSGNDSQLEILSKKKINLLDDDKKYIEKEFYEGKYIFNKFFSKYKFGIEKKLFDLLLDQDFDQLLKYTSKRYSNEQDNYNYSMHEDGTILVVDPNEIEFYNTNN